ncbi:unnamed protein product, partial [Bubo scandiacus]
AGFYVISCSYLLWSLRTFISVSPSGEAGRDSVKVTCPTPTVLPAAPVSCAASTKMS